jgi:hypothetical protein
MMEGACPRLPTLVGTLVFSIATASNSLLEFCHEATSIGCSFHQQAASIGDQLVALRKTYIGARVYRGPTGRTAQDQHWRSRSDIGRRLSGTAQDQHWSACRIGRRRLRELASRPALVGSARRCLSTGRTAQDLHWCSRLSGTDWSHCARPTLALAFRHRATSIGDCTRPTLVSLPHRATPTEGTGLKTCTGWLGSPMFVNLSPSDEVYWGPTGLNTQNQHWSDCRCL